MDYIKEQYNSLSPIHIHIKELEDQYKVLNANVMSSTSKVVEDERALLKCLLKLMPLQNTYLSSIIQVLQKQNETLSVRPEPGASSSTKVQSRTNNLDIIEDSPIDSPV